MWRRRHRHGRRGRFPKSVFLGTVPNVNSFTPNTQEDLEPVLLEAEELEAFRLVDLEGLSQEDAGVRMGVSRGTIWRLVQSARKKTARALSEGRPLSISPSVSEENRKQPHE